MITLGATTGTYGEVTVVAGSAVAGTTFLSGFAPGAVVAPVSGGKTGIGGTSTTGIIVGSSTIGVAASSSQDADGSIGISGSTLQVATVVFSKLLCNQISPVTP